MKYLNIYRNTFYTHKILLFNINFNIVRELGVIQNASSPSNTKTNGITDVSRKIGVKCGVPQPKLIPKDLGNIVDLMK